MKWEARLKRRLKLRDLDTFVTVAQCGSMAKAAAQLSVSQPAVSNAIADIERTLGVRLFDRLAQGVEPTLYGRALLKSAAAVFDEMRHGVDEIAHLIDPTVGGLRIGASEPMIAGVLPTILSRLNVQYPRIVFHVINVAGGGQQVHDLRERRFDLFLGRLLDPTNEDDLASEILFDEVVFVAAATQNPLARRRKITLADLANEPWALPASDSVLGRFVEDMFKGRGVAAPSAAVVCNSVHLQHELLVNGRFLTLVPGSVLRFGAKSSSIKILPIKLPTPGSPVGIIMLKNRTVSPVAQLFIEAAREVVKPLSKSHNCQ